MTSTDERLRTELARLSRAAQQFVLWLRPDGGQGQARRNAWRGLVEDRQRREQRIEADHYVHTMLPDRRTGDRRAPDQFIPGQYAPDRRQAAATG